MAGPIDELNKYKKILKRLGLACCILHSRFLKVYYNFYNLPLRKKF